MRRAAAEVVDDLLATGPCDFVSQVAARLPLKFICDMMGIPDDQYDMVLANSNMILAGFDPEFVSENPDQAVIQLLGAGQALADLVTSLAAERAQAPAGDLISALVTANIDGEQLTSAELASFFILLVVAGNETTRNALSHALMLFTEFPDQRALLLADLEGRIGGAVEEIVRYASPVMFMRRTLTRDYTMNGQDYREGDKAVLFYYSANRDEAVFRRPRAVRHHPLAQPARRLRRGRDRTSAWAPTWPAASSRSCCANCSAGSPTSPRASRTGCCPASSTASSGCPASSAAELFCLTHTSPGRRALAGRGLRRETRRAGRTDSRPRRGSGSCGSGSRRRR